METIGGGEESVLQKERFARHPFPSSSLVRTGVKGNRQRGKLGRDREFCNSCLFNSGILDPWILWIIGLLCLGIVAWFEFFFLCSIMHTYATPSSVQ